MAPDKIADHATSREHGKFVTGYGKNARDRYAARTVENSAMYLVPYMEKLAAAASSNNNNEAPSFTYLDVGCGPGSITLDFAQRYPQAFIVGVDPGDPFLEAAQARKEELKVNNVIFVKGDVFDLKAAITNLPQGILENKLGITDPTTIDTNGIFDVVSCHQVISHLRPAKRPIAISQMHTMARRPNGIVAAREGEIEQIMSLHPQPAGLTAWKQLFLDMYKANFINTNDTGSVAEGERHGPVFAGRHMIQIALDSGCFKRDKIKVSGSMDVFSEPTQREAWITSILPPMEDTSSGWFDRALAVRRQQLKAGSGGGNEEEGEDVTRQKLEKEVEEMVRAWKEWSQHDAAILIFGSVEIICRC